MTFSRTVVYCTYTMYVVVGISMVQLCNKCISFAWIFYVVQKFPRILANWRIEGLMQCKSNFTRMTIQKRKRLLIYVLKYNGNFPCTSRGYLQFKINYKTSFRINPFLKPLRKSLSVWIIKLPMRRVLMIRTGHQSVLLWKSFRNYVDFSLFYVGSNEKAAEITWSRHYPGMDLAFLQI